MVARWREAIKAAADESRSLVVAIGANGVDVKFPSLKAVLEWATEDKPVTIRVKVAEPKADDS